MRIQGTYYKGFSIVYLFLLILIFGSVDYFLKNLIHSYTFFPHITESKRNVTQLINSPELWGSSLGVMFKVILDVCLTSILIKAAVVVMRARVSFGKIVKTVSVCYLVFLIQFIIEFGYIKLFFHPSDYKQLGQFSFLSIAYFLNELHISYPHYLAYLFQVLGLFEFIYWGVLIIGIKRISGFSLKNSSVVVLVSYVFVLFIWLLLITYLTLINSV